MLKKQGGSYMKRRIYHAIKWLLRLVKLAISAFLLFLAVCFLCILLTEDIKNVAYCVFLLVTCLLIVFILNKDFILYTILKKKRVQKTTNRKSKPAEESARPSYSNPSTPAPQTRYAAPAPQAAYTVPSRQAIQPAPVQRATQAAPAQQETKTTPAPHAANASPIQEAKPMENVRVSAPIASTTYRVHKGSNLMSAVISYVVLDVETTGVDPTHNEIIEVGAIRVRDDKEEDSFSSLVKPSGSISKSITDLTGITNDMVEDAPGIGDVLPKLLAFIGDDIVMGHNINFDVNFIYDNCERLGLASFSNDFIDTLRISRRLYPEERQHRLCDLTSRLGVQVDEAHRALADVRATKSCYDAMVRDAALRGVRIDGTPMTSNRAIDSSTLPDNPLEGIDRIDRFDIYFIGESYRKAERLDEALALFDKAKEKGYCSPALYESYAKVYRKTKEYEKEISVLEEGIDALTIRNDPIDLLTVRKEKAEALLEKSTANQAAALEKQRLKEKKQQAKLEALAAKEASKETAKPMRRAVLQLDDNMAVVRRFESIAEAVRETGVDSKGIRNAANGVQKRAGGYMWRYEDTL